MLRDQTIYPLASDLAAHPGTVGIIYTADNNSSVGDGNGADYLWNPANTLSADGYNTLQSPSITTGRYERRTSQNVVVAVATFTAINLQTVYPVTFTNPLPGVPRGVFLQLVSSSITITAQIIVQDGSVTKTGFNIILTGLTAGATVKINYFIIK